MRGLRGFGIRPAPASTSDSSLLSAATAVAAAAGSREDSGANADGAGSGVSGASLNLAKNLVGSGVLSLPSGVAAFSASASALWPSLFFLAAAALLSAYGFFLIGRVCEETRSSTFAGAWRGSLRQGAWVPQLVCVLECLGGSIIYAMVLGDVISSLLQGIVPAALAARSTAISLVGAIVLFPLCCLRSFGQLARFSLLGTLATTYVVLFVMKRFFDGSYAPGGVFFNKAIHPVLDAVGGGGLNPNVLILVSILSTAFLVHFNAPQFYDELEPSGTPDDSKARSTKRSRFGLVGIAGFSIAAAQYALIMVFGFLTFGRATEGNLLLNYAVSDKWAVAARVAIGLSTLFGYPMQFAGLRSGLLEAMGFDGQLPKVKHRLLTGGLLGGVLLIACLFRDLGRFQAIEGALLAAFLIYIAPPLMAIRLWGGRGAKVRFTSLIAVGVFLSVIGCVVTMRA